MSRGYEKVITYTTRPMRKNEIQDKTYHFISKDDFTEKEKERFFVETSSYITEHGHWYYGSNVNDYGRDKVMIVNPDGLYTIKKLKQFNPVVFYIITNEKVIRERLEKRKDNQVEAFRRLYADNLDFMHIDNYIDYAIRNDGNLHPSQIADMILYLYQKGGHNNVT